MSNNNTKVVGIDLGTTYSAIAVLDDLGNPEVIGSIDTNKKITASAAYINGDNIIVGDKALDVAKTFPKLVVTEAKRQMENDAYFSTETGTWVERKENEEKKGFSPTQISSFILKKLKDYLEGVEKAVITVPAMFAEKARVATLDAAKLAGLEVIELINEPTAAILHYASLPGISITGKVMIFDLGGGTFDITLAEVKNKEVEVITSRGDKYLGGKDFDNELLALIQKKYQEACNTELDINESKVDFQKIAEEMKRVLSVKEKVSEVIHGSGGDHTIEITRNEFEASIQSYLEKLKMLMEECLDGSGVNPEDVNHTLLVGGSTRVPIVTKTIENVMKKPPLKGVNVDEAVANGAAIFAGLKTDKKSLNNAQQKALSNVHLQDVCNFYMGVLMNVEDPLYNRAIDINKVIIDRDTPLPASKTTSAQTIRDNQTAINCQITQSEGKQRDKEFVNIIHEGDLKLPSNRPKGQPVEITYSYDVSGKMHCVFEDVNSGKKYEVDVRPKSSEDLKAQFSEIEEITIE